MGFKRQIVPNNFASQDNLTADMAAIGIRVAFDKSDLEPNIEDTIVAASIEGIAFEDYRSLSLTVDWFFIHSPQLNADRLTKLVAGLKDKRVHAFWASLAENKKKDPRFKSLCRLYVGDRWDLMGDQTLFQISRHGEDTRFIGTKLRVPNRLLRHRPEDIQTPAELAKSHRSYYYRVMIGPSYRADMWALIEAEPNLSAADIAHRTYGSFATAWETKRDWNILH